MALPIDVEQKLAACAQEIERMKQERLLIEESIDEVLSSDGEDAIPEETFDDPSIVREVRELERVQRRVRRSSASPVAPVTLRRG